MPFILILVALINLGIVGKVVVDYQQTIHQSPTSTSTATPVETSIPKLEGSTTTIPCGPGQNSGQYVYLKTASECQNYTDCGLNDGSWKLMTISECSVAQGKTNSSAKIDCAGPDGKQFKTTQKECDSFNKAWDKTTQTTNNPSNNASRSLIPCNTAWGFYYASSYEDCVNTSVAATKSKYEFDKYREQDKINLQNLQSTFDKTNEIMNRTFEVGPLPTIAPLAPWPTISPPTPTPCTPVFPGFGGSVSNPC